MQVMMQRNFLALLAVLLLVGCATRPQGPAQTVYAAHGNYTAGLTVALQYKRLPACGPTVSKLCKDPALMKKLLAADDKAFEALTVAQKAVRVGDGPQAAASATAAQSAIAEFRKITSTLRVTP